MKSFHWQKLGFIFSPDSSVSWMDSHSQVPRALELGDILRVYFATREKPDANGNYVSRIGFVDLDKQNPTRLVGVSKEPALDLGEVGSFDEFGVMPGDLKIEGDKVRLLYTGWSRGATFPYVTWIGEAYSHNSGASFVRTSNLPKLGPTDKEKILCNGPFTFKTSASETILYSSALRWIRHGGRYECLYVIMKATRTQSGHWHRNGLGCIPTLHDLECQNAPTIFQRDGYYHVFFCHRHALDFRNSERGYKLGHAWSDDLEVWHRDDSFAVLHGAPSKWEEQMQCYPGIVETTSGTYMFYCGNNFGRSGFGVARLN
jgi:hypothetical protein